MLERQKLALKAEGDEYVFCTADNIHQGKQWTRNL